MNWDVRALADHLRSHGLPDLRMARSEDLPGATYFFLNGFQQESIFQVQQADGLGNRIVFLNSVLRVTDQGSAPDAESFVRQLGDDERDNYFAWGRFVLFGSATARQRAKNAPR
jgi:hypothetical protein